MTKYLVIIPIAGYVSTEVEAETEDKAKEIALAKQFPNDDIEEWYTYKSLILDNVIQIETPTEIEVEELS